MAETLAAPRCAKDCLLSKQSDSANEIKYLAQIGGNTMLRRNTRCRIERSRPILGISQALSAHLPVK
jgi:hypothetical protein